MASSVVQFPVDDSSPTVLYAPFGDTFSSPSLADGWNPHWDDPGFSSAIPGATGSGTSLHITSLNNASLQINWKGTGIKLFGNVTRSSYVVTIDNQATDASATADLGNSTLLTIDNLADTSHTLTLTVQTEEPDSLFQFDRALVSAPPSPNNVSSSNFTEQTLNDTAVAFQGQWSFSDSSHQSTTAGDSASLHFTGTSFLLRGSISPQAGNYSVTLDNVTTSFSAKSSFSQPDSLLFFASGLDAELDHKLKITNTQQGATLVLPLGGASVWALAESPSSPSSSASSNPSSSSASTSAIVPNGLSSGTIAALVLAGVLLFFVAVCALLYFFLYRPYRRRQQLNRRSPKTTPDRDATSSILVVDVAPEMESMSKKGFYEDVPVAGPSRDRTSKRSGFSKWKDEVEGGLGSWSRGALGIAFRHSDSTGRRDASGSSQDYDLGAISDGYKSTSSSSNGDYPSKGKGKDRERSRWSRRSRDKSLSPRFRLDLPMETTRSRSGSNRSNAPSAAADHSVISSLSYLSSPSLHPTNLPSAPPSPIRPSPYPNAHSRVGSDGVLLAHMDEPRAEQAHQAPRLPPPTTTLPTPPGHVPPQDPHSLTATSRQDDRGSVREFDADDGRSILGDGSARIALRSLSPRTSESEHRAARSKRRAKEKKDKPLRSSPLANPHRDPPSFERSAESGLNTNLSLRSTSPFQVDFDHPDRSRAARLSTQSRVRFEGVALAAEANDQGGHDQASGSLGTDENPRQPPRPPQAPFRLTASTDHLRDTSFLDFSSDGSIRSRSNDYSSSSRSYNSRGPSGHSHWSSGGNSNVASLVPPPQPRSRWSATTAPSSDFQHDASRNGSSDSNFPFPVSLPASPHHPEGTFMQPPPSTADRPGPHDSMLSSLNAHPTSLLSEIPTSPTDSDVPMSISDIHFRNSDNDEPNGSHRQSTVLPSHPPLPPIPDQQEASYIVQRTVGALLTPTPTASRFNTTPSPATIRQSPGSSGRGL
ncbi:hypothetical protein C8R47DRAFT_1317469 [Mycena vitilis]|nr:hypothetical protein C8R47DRAFT_1317469 [Mycena vitilis]